MQNKAVHVWEVHSFVNSGMVTSTEHVNLDNSSKMSQPAQLVHNFRVQGIRLMRSSVEALRYVQCLAFAVLNTFKMSMLSVKLAASTRVMSRFHLLQFPQKVQAKHCSKEVCRSVQRRLREQYP